jgi:hypothetical protein
MQGGRLGYLTGSARISAGARRTASRELGSAVGGPPGIHDVGDHQVRDGFVDHRESDFGQD